MDPSQMQEDAASNNELETSLHAQKRLAADGFTRVFSLEDDAVVDLESKASYRPEDVEIISTHRNEGDTDPGDESVVFALRAPDGARGVLATNYGHDAPHADALRRLGTAVGS